MNTQANAAISLADRDAKPPASVKGSIRATYQRLRMVGLTPAEAGNLTAHLNGLQVTDRGWTLQEIERILFIRALVDLGRIES